MTITMSLREKVRKAVGERDSLARMRKSFETIAERRATNSGRIPDLQPVKERVRKVKETSVGNEGLLAEAISSLRENGCRVVLVKTGEAAVDFIADEVAGHSLVVKSKSNVSKQLRLSESLSERGIEVIETDLGDRIVQLMGCPAVHPTGPACHLGRKEISELLSRHFGRMISDDPKELTEAVREEISGYVERAKVGITGANVIAAREGAIVIVHNEGNAARCASLPEKHIVVTTPEKVVPDLRDAIDVTKLQTLYSTGKVISSYIEVISGPSYTADIEKMIYTGMHGPKEVIVVIVDDGRQSLSDPESLYCIGCGSCLTRCPVYSIVGPVFGTPGRVGGLGVGMLASMGRLKEADDAGLFLCTSCGGCREVCPVDIDTRKVLLKGREAFVGQKLEGTAERDAIVGSVRNYDNPWQMPRARRSRWSREMALPSEGEIVYFAGCSTSFLFPESAKGAIRLLRAAGMEPAYIGSSERCCGSILRKLGETELAREKAESCYMNLAKAGAKVVVTSCPGCYSTLDAYPEFKERYGIEIRHISQILCEHLDKLKIVPVKAYGKVTYHDPCDLGREKAVFDEPRALLDAALETPAVEMRRSRSESACCGAGSGVKSGFGELASAIAMERISQAVAAGADTLVTACPWCFQNLRECQNSDQSVAVVDLMELLLSALSDQR
ncbi:MAG: LUD domain-containing protein [Methanobacteriota archaeon]|nr:MAG: LUD domain-containing protein [Euryarchaeota archaeon]